MSFERFDIRDRETGEWIHDLTREMLAQYVLGKLPGTTVGALQAAALKGGGS